MTLDNTVKTTGNGVNLNLGAILVPVDFMRIGLALHTPMFYSLTTYNYSTLSFNSSEDGNIESPENYVDYQLQSPLQFNVSAAFLVDKQGLISAEYVFNNYRGMKLLDKMGIHRIMQLITKILIQCLIMREPLKLAGNIN